MKKEKSQHKKKRAWLFFVMPLLFLAVGAGAFFGLKYYFEQVKNDAEQNEMPENELKNDDEDEKDESEDIESIEPAEPVEAIGASPFAGSSLNANGTNSTTTYNAIMHEIDGVKYIYYKTLTWGSVESDFEDFRLKVKETLNDERGWTRLGVKFVEVTEGQDLNVVLSDPASLEGYNGYCSWYLSCTSSVNEIILNDVRWREGTEETVAGNMSQRDYQHMVVNHEMGHWLGHYSHIESCDVDGGVAPIMLQQSTGLRNCGSFNPWPLDSELWTLR